jgi:hypothetical protein
MNRGQIKRIKEENNGGTAVDQVVQWNVDLEENNRGETSVDKEIKS